MGWNPLRRGFRRGRRASAQSRRFFWVLERLLEEQNGDGRPVHIQTAEWSMGEAQPDDCGYRLDGLLISQPPERSLGIEYQGCYFHGMMITCK